MKQTKTSSGLRFLWLYLFLSVVIIAGIQMIFDPYKPPVEFHYMDKADMFEIVRNNTQTILGDIEKKNYTRTLNLLSSARDEPHVYRKDNCVTFDCYGFESGPSTSYEGFYYTPCDGPAWICGIETSWVLYSFPLREDPGQTLTQEGDEWVWYGKSVNPGWDNEYHTEKICDNFWYYRLVY